MAAAPGAAAAARGRRQRGARGPAAAAAAARRGARRRARRRCSPPRACVGGWGWVGWGARRCVGATPPPSHAAQRSAAAQRRPPRPGAARRRCRPPDALQAQRGRRGHRMLADGPQTAHGRGSARAARGSSTISVAAVQKARARGRGQAGTMTRRFHSLRARALRLRRGWVERSDLWCAPRPPFCPKTGVFENGSRPWSESGAVGRRTVRGAGAGACARAAAAAAAAAVKL
jgi:hypothetical protein